MTIEIISTSSYKIEPTDEIFRQAEIIITSGATSFMWTVGGLSVAGDLQAILDGREAELWVAAQAGGRTVDLYELALKRVLKAFALVILDELNILRTRAGLAIRTAGMIDDAIKAKLKVI